MPLCPTSLDGLRIMRAKAQTQIDVLSLAIDAPTLQEQKRKLIGEYRAFVGRIDALIAEARGERATRR